LGDAGLDDGAAFAPFIAAVAPAMAPPIMPMVSLRVVSICSSRFVEPYRFLDKRSLLALAIRLAMGFCKFRQ
jgi:hypothetical protein